MPSAVPPGTLMRATRRRVESEKIPTAPDARRSAKRHRRRRRRAAARCRCRRTHPAADRDDRGECEIQTDTAKTLKFGALFAPDSPSAYIQWLECEARAFVATERFRRGFAALLRSRVVAEQPTMLARTLRNSTKS